MVKPKTGLAKPITGLPAVVDHYAWDTRTGLLFSFRRLKSYVLLKDPEYHVFSKISNEEFEEFFEGCPKPEPPFLMVLR